eukprot:m.66067 g.66067  ORF g.66067 m.66067 type:complete len:1472 (+) comp9798_c0_seq2:173-4588(+)
MSAPSDTTPLLVNEPPSSAAVKAAGPGHMTYILQPDDDAASALADTHPTGADHPVRGGRPVLHVARAVPWWRQFCALVVFDARLVARRRGVLMMLVLAPALLVLAGFGFTFMAGLTSSSVTACGKDGYTPALDAVPALFVIPTGLSFPCLAAVITLSAETRGKRIRAIVNLATPLSAVYCAWFVCFAGYAAVGATLAAAVGVATRMHLFTHCEFFILLGIFVSTAVANVALGMVCGSFFTRPLLVHAQNALFLGLVLTMLMIPPACFDPAKLAITQYTIITNPSLYVDARYEYQDECYTFPSSSPALWIPSDYVRGPAFAWFPSSNALSALTDVVSLQFLGGNSSSGLPCTSTDNSTTGDSSCTYSYDDFAAPREYAYFVNGTYCLDITCPPPPPPPEVGFYEAPSGRDYVLANSVLIVGYLVLALVIANVFPHGTGVRPLFKSKRSIATGDPSGDASARKRLAGVHVSNVVKEYRKGKVAVDKVTATMRSGEVFALLGHNGAGKSTLFEMLAGNLDATSGAGTIYGYDMATQMDEIRRISSYCQQDDVLWHELTAREHFDLWLTLRGQHGPSVQKEASEILRELNLMPVADRRAGTYSGGMQRRLSVALACVGDDVKVLLFDEPTTGLDPVHRRMVWNRMQKSKKNRTIIVTTHSMDEAELLADRIGILNNGVLRAYGTPIFLKRAVCGMAERFRVSVIPAPDTSIEKTVGHIAAITPCAKRVPCASSDDAIVMSIGEEGIAGVEKLFAWLDQSPTVSRWRMFNVDLTEVFALVGGHDVDATRGVEASKCCGVKSGKLCCCCCASAEPSTAAAEEGREGSAIDTTSATTALAALVTASEPAAASTQMVVVLVKNLLVLYRGSWHSLVFVLVLCTLPIVILTWALKSDDLNGLWVMVCFGIGASLMLPWLVVVAVQDNADGIFELMFVQGLRVKAHVIGTFIYAFGAMSLAHAAIFLLCFVSGSPALWKLDDPARWCVLILALTCQSFWTACVTILGASCFKATGTAAGVVGLATMCLVGTALGLVMLQGIIYAQTQKYDDDLYQQPHFFSNPYPTALSLAPYFGFFRALWMIGDKSNKRFGDMIIALALTLVQGLVYASIGVAIYLRQVSRRIDMSAAPEDLKQAQRREYEDAAPPLAQFAETTKQFGDKVVLDHLQLAIQHGECLGLLGPNGAGKSTAFNIMAGLLKSTSGDALIEGYSIHRHTDEARLRLGWCPQFPRVWPDLTVADHLGLFTMLRGLPSPFSLRRSQRAEGHKTVRLLADVMQLGGASLTKKASQLSGGMRRRLSLAISLVGAPPMMILDEPTTGLDPLTRGKVWELLGALRRESSRRGIIISTHSMEEATALCNRIAILTHGKLQVYGTQDELKREYGTGYTVQLSVVDEGFDVRRFLAEEIDPGAAVRTSTGKVFNCHVPAEVNLSRLFQALSVADTNGTLREWLVAETSLEDVFVRIVASSDDEIAAATNCSTA